MSAFILIPPGQSISKYLTNYVTIMLGELTLILPWYADLKCHLIQDRLSDLFPHLDRQRMALLNTKTHHVLPFDDVPAVFSTWHFRCWPLIPTGNLISIPIYEIEQENKLFATIKVPSDYNLNQLHDAITNLYPTINYQIVINDDQYFVRRT